MKTRDADELLKKVRKGATAGFNVQDWLCCLAFLGWTWSKHNDKGTTAYDITAANGKSFWLKKEAGYRCIVFYDFTKWAKEQGLIEQVEAIVGVEPVKPERLDVENTGTCPCCFGAFKLMKCAPAMVFHGYQRPGHGYTLGKCHGVGCQPYELSCAGTVAFLALVKDLHAITVAELQALRLAMAIRVTHRGEEKVLTAADGWTFEDARRLQVNNQEYKIKCQERDIEFLTGKVDDWKLAPLPGEKK